MAFIAVFTLFCAAVFITMVGLAIASTATGPHF